eukprot:scaffold454_cov124-Isochrysis_galbana.AAC.21
MARLGARWATEDALAKQEGAGSARLPEELGCGVAERVDGALAYERRVERLTHDDVRTGGEPPTRSHSARFRTRRVGRFACRVAAHPFRRPIHTLFRIRTRLRFHSQLRGQAAVDSEALHTTRLQGARCRLGHDPIHLDRVDVRRACLSRHHPQQPAAGANVKDATAATAVPAFRPAGAAPRLEARDGSSDRSPKWYALHGTIALGDMPGGGGGGATTCRRLGQAKGRPVTKVPSGEASVSP